MIFVVIKVLVGSQVLLAAHEIHVVPQYYRIRPTGGIDLLPYTLTVKYAAQYSPIKPKKILSSNKSWAQQGVLSSAPYLAISHISLAKNCEFCVLFDAGCLVIRVKFTICKWRGYFASVWVCPSIQHKLCYGCRYFFMNWQVKSCMLLSNSSPRPKTRRWLCFPLSQDKDEEQEQEQHSPKSNSRDGLAQRLNTENRDEETIVAVIFVH